jgi:hypothetical protein
MIVSHRHRLIFLKPRKVAGTSFEIALCKYVGEGDIVTPIHRDDEPLRNKLGFSGPQNFNYWLSDLFSKDRVPRILGRQLPLKYYNHMPARLVRDRLPHAVWRGYRKISLIRNPWDRAVSIFFWKNRGGQADLADFTSYFLARPELLEWNYENYMIDGEDVIDHYLRYEHFEQDIQQLEREIPSLAGLWKTFKSVNAKGQVRKKAHTTAEIFADNPRVHRLIQQRNAWEIEKFSYRLSSAPREVKRLRTSRLEPSVSH